MKMEQRRGAPRCSEKNRVWWGGHEVLTFTQLLVAPGPKPHLGVFCGAEDKFLVAG